MIRQIVLLVTSCAMLLGITSTYAQENPRTWAPSEIFGCTYADGADEDDLNGVIETWNEWMDANGNNEFTAILLSPYFTAASFPFEVLWVGIWENGAALAGIQQWLAEGGEVEEGFVNVLDCPGHSGMAINTVKELGEPTGIVPVEFTNCTVNEGRTGGEAHDAIIEYTEFLTENGSDAGHWIMRPGVGEEADADYTFKWVTAYTSYASLGHDFDLHFNGGGAQRLNQLTGRIMSCDSARVYNSRLLRESADN
jgi:hypothetical protein